MAEMTFVSNDGIVEIDELRDIDDTYQNAATVALIDVIDAAGNTVAGLTLPLSLAYVAASDGMYRCTLQDTAVLTPGETYTAIVTVDSGGLQARFEIPFTARTRTTR